MIDERPVPTHADSDLFIVDTLRALMIDHALPLWAGQG